MFSISLWPAHSYSHQSYRNLSYFQYTLTLDFGDFHANKSLACCKKKKRKVNQTLKQNLKKTQKIPAQLSTISFQSTLMMKKLDNAEVSSKSS